MAGRRIFLRNLHDPHTPEGLKANRSSDRSHFFWCALAASAFHRPENGGAGRTGSCHWRRFCDVRAAPASPKPACVHRICRIRSGGRDFQSDNGYCRSGRSVRFEGKAGASNRMPCKYVDAKSSGRHRQNWPRCSHKNFMRKNRPWEISIQNASSIYWFRWMRRIYRQHRTMRLIENCTRQTK